MAIIELNGFTDQTEKYVDRALSKEEKEVYRILAIIGVSVIAMGVMAGCSYAFHLSQVVNILSDAGICVVARVSHYALDKLLPCREDNVSSKN